jgi:hypothetical protein
MKNLILRVMDWNGTWVGLQWLRPRPTDPITGKAALTIVGFTSVMTVLLAVPLAYGMQALFGMESNPVVLIVCAFSALALNAVLQLLSAVYWNERALELRSMGQRMESLGHN